MGAKGHQCCSGGLCVDIGLTCVRFWRVCINARDEMLQESQPSDLGLGLQGFRGMRKGCSSMGGRCLKTAI